MKHFIALFLTLFLTASIFAGNKTNENICFSVSPNPADDHFTLAWFDSDYEGGMQIIIYDEVGKQIDIVDIDRYETPIEVDVSTLEAGAYFVRVIDEISSHCQTVRLMVY